MKQQPAVGLYNIYKIWQESLKQLTDSLPHDFPCIGDPFPGSRRVGDEISSQIFQLLGQRTFPSKLEADLISLQQLFIDFDAIQTQRERQARLTQAQKILRDIDPESRIGLLASARPESPAPAISKAQRLNQPYSTSRENLWNIPIRYAKGVGPRRARLLDKLGVVTIEDAFWFLPWRYEDWSEILPIHQLQSNMKVTISGKVTSCQLRRTSRKGLVIVTISVNDGTGTLEAVFFNQPFLEQTFVVGTPLVLHGEISTGKSSFAPLRMQGPQYELLRSDMNAGKGLSRLVPVYHETKGITTRQFRRVLKGLHERYEHAIEELLSPDLLEELQLPPLRAAMTALHFPENTENVEMLNQGITFSHRRLAFEEFLLLQLALAVRRRMVKIESEGIAFSASQDLVRNFRDLLPFRLTAAQQRVIQEIQADMVASTSMNRLLQGDVGSGKTMVALHAMVLACGSGYQAVLMAPTEVLSEQHFLTLEPYFTQLGLTAVLIKGGQSAQERAKYLKQLASGQAQVALGTHALLQPEVMFQDLGLVVVDEQHKFGVVQRAQLRKKSARLPDVLVMTATPIPRTLAMTVYGDLDVSVIDALPPGRKPVETFLFNASKRERAYALLRKEVEAGRQAYIVYPLVEPSEKMDLQAAAQAADELQRKKFPELKVGLLHGRMKSKDKQTIMKAFKEGTIHILVATTVIEVGVDVSNATVLLIEHAERFGLAQLHQLRGRVGRGTDQAYCLLVQSASKPVVRESQSGPLFNLPPSRDLPASEVSQHVQTHEDFQRESHRLQMFSRCADGFTLAEEDLKIRGPGNLLGVQQWGAVDFRVAQLLRDQDLLHQAKRVASQLTSQDPQLKASELQGLKAAMLRKWGKTFELGSIG